MGRGEGENNRRAPFKNFCLGLRKELTLKLVLRRIRCRQKKPSECLKTLSWSRGGRSWHTAYSRNKDEFLPGCSLFL